MKPTTESVTSKFPTRQIGRNGPIVSALGLGCMGMSEFYGSTDNARNLRTLAHALDHGITFLDTADIYGPFTNEELLGRFLAGQRERVVLATKCGILRDPNDHARRGVDNTPAYIRASCEASLRRLGVETIDLYYLHRHNPDSAPIEDAVGAMAELIAEGKIRHIGLSEVNEKTLRRAHAVHPIAALQSEYSLWSREPETNGTLDACRELGVSFVPYSPIGRGFLSGAITRFEDFAENDFRRNLPRFQGENFQKNLDIVRTLKELAAERKVKPVQLALAWVLAQGEDIIPIPGTTRVEHLDELIDAVGLELNEDELRAISEAFPVEAAAGDRYYATMRPFIGR
ncbi:MAG TPA: aldo/keto reductase [Opitutaceae bacterium]|nr:aldo/keto reductase [Opitutaceae bacterium]